jgi:hypothetical protein
MNEVNQFVVTVEIQFDLFKHKGPSYGSPSSRSIGQSMRLMKEVTLKEWEELQMSHKQKVNHWIFGSQTQRSKVPTNNKDWQCSVGP